MSPTSGREARVTPTPPQPLPGAGLRRLEWGLNAAALLLALGALALAVNTLRQTISAAEIQPALSIATIFQYDLAATRMLCGVLLVLAWPLVLRVAATMLKITFSRPNQFLTLFGIILGSATYVLTFLPGPGLAAAILLPAILSLILIRGLLQLSWKHAIGLWMLQGIGISLFLATSIWGLESLAAGSPLNPVRELPKIYEVAQRPPQVIQVVWPGKRDTTLPPLIWEPTGSYWLDYRANRVHLEIQNADRSGDWAVSLSVMQAGNTLSEIQAAAEQPHRINFVARPHVEHRITITPNGVQDGDAARIWCLLPLANTL